MCHIGGVADRPMMSQVLDLLRPGDILTHCYSGAPNLAGDGTNIVQDGKLLPAALEAKRRGVIFDIGHGGGSFDYTIAEAAIAQGCPPDTISSDIHVFSGNTPGMPYLPWVMSKLDRPRLLAVRGGGDGDDDAGARDRPPAQARHAAGGRAGRCCRSSSWSKARSSSSTRATTSAPDKMHLRPVGAVVAGVAFGRPYQSPFARALDGRRQAPAAARCVCASAGIRSPRWFSISVDDDLGELLAARLDARHRPGHEHGELAVRHLQRHRDAAEVDA